MFSNGKGSVSSRRPEAVAAGDDERRSVAFVTQVAHLVVGSALRRRSTRYGALLALVLVSCDPVPPHDAPPPGGYRARPTATGRAAIRAVLYTPSHGSFRTVREAVRTYLSRATDAVQVDGWSAAGVTSSTRRYYQVDFGWFDGREVRTLRVR